MVAFWLTNVNDTNPPTTSGLMSPESQLIQINESSGRLQINRFTKKKKKKTT